MPRPFGQNMATADTLLASASRSGSGIGNPVRGFGKVSAIRAQVAVTAITGTLPTLDVVLEDSIDGGTTWNQIAAFPQLVAAGSKAVNIAAPFGDMVRARYTVGGVSASATCEVLAYTQ